MDDIRHFRDESANSTTPKRRTPWDTVEGRVISMVSRKGGVGKTTSTVNIGAALALSGHTVLVVGTDPQCGVCRSLGVKQADLPTCLTAIFNDTRSLTDLAQPSPLKDLFFVSPRITSLSEEESYLRLMEEKIDDFVREIDRARHLYDTILIDCPPSLGIPTRASLLASDSYLVPIQAEELCRNSLDDLLAFIKTFRSRNFPAAKLMDGFRDPLQLEGLFLTMASDRTRMGKHVAARVSQQFGDQLFDIGIPRTTRLSEMALRGKPAVIYDRRSAGSRAYFDLTDQLVLRYLKNSNQADVTLANDAAEEDHRSAGTSTDHADSTEHSAKSALAGSGLEKLLAELGPRSSKAGCGPVSPEELSEPEMVSLDELLAEEEGQRPTQNDWDEDLWSFDKNQGDRLN